MKPKGEPSNEKTAATDVLSREKPHPPAKDSIKRIRGRQLAELLGKPGLLEEAISQDVRRLLKTQEIEEIIVK